jgi:hypothetical protein
MFGVIKIDLELFRDSKFANNKKIICARLKIEITASKI